MNNNVSKNLIFIWSCLGISNCCKTIL